MEQNLILLIVAFLMVLVLGMQVQIRSVSKKIDELLNRNQ